MQGYLQDILGDRSSIASEILDYPNSFGFMKSI
jgi:hypothetical protein